jgi:hypothetical protein
MQKHILDNQYAYGPIQDIVDVSGVETKGVSMDVQKIYQICRVGKQGSMLNEQHTTEVSVLFELALAKNG